MRIDARNLLEKLGKNDFAYREFEDRFTELELWPILEALLRDRRLQAIDQAENAADTPLETEEQVDAFHTFAEAVVASTESGEALNSLFSRYGEAGAPASHRHDPQRVERRSAHSPDVRAMLRHLSDLGSRGEI